MLWSCSRVRVPVCACVCRRRLGVCARVVSTILCIFPQSRIALEGPSASEPSHRHSLLLKHTTTCSVDRCTECADVVAVVACDCYRCVGVCREPLRLFLFRLFRPVDAATPLARPFTCVS